MKARKWRSLGSSQKLPKTGKSLAGVSKGLAEWVRGYHLLWFVTRSLNLPTPLLRSSHSKPSLFRKELVFLSPRQQGTSRHPLLEGGYKGISVTWQRQASHHKDLVLGGGGEGALDCFAHGARVSREWRDSDTQPLLLKIWSQESPSEWTLKLPPNTHWLRRTRNPHGKSSAGQEHLAKVWEPKWALGRAASNRAGR